MLSAVFISRGVDALRSPKPAADAARPTLEGLSKLPDPVGTNVPANAETVARVNAAVQIGGGLLLASGRLPRLASAALALSVVPGSLGGHMFWSQSDPQRKADERRAFLTDVSLIGGLIIAAVDTEGKPSLGWRGRRAAKKAQASIAAALPLVASQTDHTSDRVEHALSVASECGSELAETAKSHGTDWLELAKERSSEFAEIGSKRAAEFGEVAKERGPDILEVAQKHGSELAETARERSAELAELASKRSSEFAELALEKSNEWAETASEQTEVLGKRARKRAEKALEKARAKKDELTH